MVIVKDATQKDLIEDSICCICLGVVRLPGKMCNHCSKIFCEICVGKISGYAGGNIVNAANPNVLSTEIRCPCCKLRTQWTNLKFPIFLKNQIEQFEFRCKKKNCNIKKKLSKSVHEQSYTNQLNLISSINKPNQN
jgi:hypothetical protein